MNLVRFSIVACCLILCLSTVHAETIDLRKASLNEGAKVDGKWEFYWNQLLNPGVRPSMPGVPVSFPSLWTGVQALPAYGYATYAVTVLLPKNAGPIQLRTPDVYTAFRLFVNGKVVAEVGRVSKLPSGFIPHWQPKTVDLPVNIDTIRLVLQVANFVHSKGGVGSSMIIGNRDTMEVARIRSDAIDFSLTGCLLMAGMFFLGLYLLGNRDKAILYFSLFTIIYSYRVIGTENYALHQVLPNLNWQFTVRLEYISLFAGIGLFGMYSRHLYPKDQHGRIVSTVGGICGLFTLATLVLPSYYFTQLINPFLFVALFCLCYVPYLYVQAYRKKRPGALYSLWSAVVLMTLFAISLLHYWHFVPQLQLLSFFGYVAFFFLQSLVLSHRVSFTLKKATEQASAGLKAKSDFLSTMSHEIRTPLNSVIGMTHYLLENNPRKDQLDQLNAMVFSANNLLHIVNDVLDYSKIEAGMIKFEELSFDLAKLAGNIIANLSGAAEEKGLKLTFNADIALQNQIIGDPTRIAQVLTNPVHNAIKFTTTGSVTVTLEVKEQSDSSLCIRICVRDTGIGISAEKQDLIFERFTQANSSISRSFGGTGLGLSISKRILELQGSSLQLQSEPGKGSTFSFTHQFVKGGLIAGSPEKRDSDLKVPNLQGIAVLLVDDNPMNVMVAKSFLVKWGAMVDVATNGQEAIDQLDIHIHQLILMDLHMPVLDGYAATKIIRTNGVQLPIIALTASVPSEIKDEVAAAGLDDILVKPFRPTELYEIIVRHLIKQPSEFEVF